MTQTYTEEAPGLPPAYVLDPRAEPIDEEGRSLGPMISARFFIGPDPRTDPVDQPIVGPDGNIPIVEMVEVINRNDPRTIMVQISTDIHRYKLYPREYAAFKQGLDVQTTGVPIREWLGENARTQKLATFHIHTVEQLAAASDSLCQTLGPGTYDLRKRANTYLAAHKDTALAERAIAENDALRGQMAEMQAQMSRLMASINAGQAKAGAEQDLTEIHPAEQDPLIQKRKPGRPPSHI